MKKGIVLLLCALLLSGCGKTEQPVDTTVPTTTAAPTDPGCYMPGSDAEISSEGALRQYDLGDRKCFALGLLGEHLLLISGEDTTQLELITKEEGKTQAQCTLPVDLRAAAWAVLNNGFAYYYPEQNAAVILDVQLQEVQTLSLPADIQGMPLFAPDGGEIFYCVGQEIRALDTDRGISRLIKSHPCKSQCLTDVYFDGTLLRCETVSEADEQSFLYISAQDGATVLSDASVEWLDTDGAYFVASRMDGVVRQYIFGSRNDALQQLNLLGGHVVPSAALQEAVHVTREDDGALGLSLYSLDTGTQTAQVKLPAAWDTADLWADSSRKAYWVLLGGEKGRSLLLWEPQRTQEGDAVYTSPLYTKEAPDAEGLKQLQKRVDSLNKTHGVMIRIWETALKTTGMHTFEPEFQTAAISDTLDRVESVLTVFPERFLSRSASGKIRICIVRSLDGEGKSTVFWDDGDPFIVISAGVDVENELLMGIANVVDSHILGNSPIVDDWDALNPEGFVYSAEAPQSVDYLAYLQADGRVFADADSMRSVSEDRARIFWQAMQSDNGEMFSSEVMQAKLLLLCRSIRDAWRLEYKTETYPWEQYLDASIAYVK